MTNTLTTSFWRSGPHILLRWSLVNNSIGIGKWVPTSILCSHLLLSAKHHQPVTWWSWTVLTYLGQQKIGDILMVNVPCSTGSLAIKVDDEVQSVGIHNRFLIALIDSSFIKVVEFGEKLARHSREAEAEDERRQQDRPKDKKQTQALYEIKLLDQDCSSYHPDAAQDAALMLWLVSCGFVEV